jgi:hypothetical protein
VAPVWSVELGPAVRAGDQLTVGDRRPSIEGVDQTSEFRQGVGHLAASAVAHHRSPAVDDGDGPPTVPIHLVGPASSWYSETAFPRIT